MAEKLLEKIPVETCWALTAKTLTRFVISRMKKTSAPFLGKDDGIFSLLSGWDKELEIKEKIFGEAARKMYPFVKETFNIPVDDAIGAIKLGHVVATLQSGPEWEYELVEASSERAIWRITTCTWWERWKEQEVDPELIPCISSCPAWVGEGTKAVNPKITYTLTKARPRGDPYCDWVFEFKDE